MLNNRCCERCGIYGERVLNVFDDFWFCEECLRAICYEFRVSIGVIDDIDLHLDPLKVN